MRVREEREGLRLTEFTIDHSSDEVRDLSALRVVERGCEPVEAVGKVEVGRSAEVHPTKPRQAKLPEWFREKHP